MDSLGGTSKDGRKKPKHKHGHGGDSFSEREWIDLAFCLDYVRHVSSLSADLSCSLALCTGIAIRVLFGVGRDHGAQNPRLGGVVPSILAVARHLLRLSVPSCFGRCLLSRWCQQRAEKASSFRPRSASFLAGIAIPLITPRQYVPLDPKARFSFLSRHRVCS